jgi:hypothetical protein
MTGVARVTLLQPDATERTQVVDIRDDVHNRPARSYAAINKQWAWHANCFVHRELPGRS